MKQFYRPLAWIFVLAGVIFPSAVLAQYRGVGEIAQDFSVENYLTGGTYRLSDFAGSVVVLDFFRYW